MLYKDLVALPLRNAFKRVSNDGLMKMNRATSFFSCHYYLTWPSTTTTLGSSSSGSAAGLCWLLFGQVIGLAFFFEPWRNFGSSIVGCNVLPMTACGRVQARSVNPSHRPTAAAAGNKQQQLSNSKKSLEKTKTKKKFLVCCSALRIIARH